MKKSFILVTVVALLVMLMPGCAPEGAQAPTSPAPEQVAPPPTDEPIPAPDTEEAGPSPAPEAAPGPEPTPAGEEGNFRLLISDEVNAIEDFQQLHVTISSIGVHEAGGAGKWHEFDLNPNDDLDGDTIPGLDLRPLVDENALVIWSGNITAGEYNKVFIYVDSVTGILDGTDGDEAVVKLPSDKLQISKPFTIGDSVVNFVYDITVVKAGNSGKYNLKPQIAQSGSDKPFDLVTAGGGPEDTGKSKGKGKPEGQEDEELEFEGTITSLDPLVIAGYTVVLDGAQVEGELKEGITARVEGLLQEDGSVLALKIEVEEEEDTTPPVTSVSEEADDDTTPPVISVSGVANDQQYTAPVTPIIEVYDDTDAEPTVLTTLNGNSFTSGTVIDQVGEYELEITATDAGGNEAEVTIAFEIVEAE